MKYGALLGKTDLRDYRLKVSGISNLPSEYELSFIPKTKNQGSVNSCVAFTTSSIAEYFEKIQCNDNTELSAGYIYGTRYSYEGEGMYLRDALKTLTNKGICINDLFKYNLEVPEIITKLQEANITDEQTKHRKITKYFRLNSINDIKKAIYDYGPVMISVFWYDNNKINEDVLVKGSGSGGYHCIMLYGWNEIGFKFLNSWGKNWGNKGTAILPYDYTIEEAYGIEDSNTDKDNDIVIPTKNNWFLDLILKIINWLINLFK